MWHRIEDSNYEVSNLGQVRNINTKQIRKLRAGVTSPYLMVQIYIGNGKRKNYLVHRLVAKYFIENPYNKEQVNHIDGNKLNNIYCNLEWVTPKENMSHALKSGLYKKYNNQTYKGKFGAEHNRSIKIECNGIIYNGYSEASRKTGVSISTISMAIKQNRACKGMHFQLSKI
jgi:hypothetical protein